MNFTQDIVATLCAGLDNQPLFHLSLGSKGLFLSNFRSTVLSTVSISSRMTISRIPRSLSIPDPLLEAASSVL
jgi:hypothetical protein